MQTGDERGIHSLGKAPHVRRQKQPDPIEEK